MWRNILTSLILAGLAWLAMASAGCSANAMLSKDQFQSAAWSNSRIIEEYELAHNLIADGKYHEAQEKLAPLLAEFERTGDEVHASESIFWVGYCYEKLHRTKQAGDEYRKVIRKYPHSRAAAQAKDSLSRLPGSA